MLIFALLVYCHTSGSAQTIRHIRITGPERTRLETIKRELLFKEGEPFNTTRIAESARNLRRLPFLGRVQLVPYTTGEHVDIEVRVQELFARALSPVIAGSINALEYGLVAVDYNLGGRGQRLRMAAGHHPYVGKNAELSLLEPRLLGSEHSFFTRLYRSEEGHDVQWALTKPFLALGHLHSYGIRLRDTREQTRLWEASRIVARYRTADRSAHFWYGTSHGTDTKVRPRLEISYQKKQAPQKIGSTYSIDHLAQLHTRFSLNFWQPQYTTDRFIHALGPIEDIQTGSALYILLGYTHGFTSAASSYTHLGLQFSPRWHLRDSTYLFSSFYIGSRQTQSRIEHGITIALFRVYRRISPNHSVAFRLRWDSLHRPEGIQQLSLGINTGLRGFAENQWIGNRRLILNSEFRPTFFQTPWAALGAAIFADLGAAWVAPQTPSLQVAIGCGIRLGLLRIYNTPVWRLDLARNGENGWHLSLGMGQYF